MLSLFDFNDVNIESYGNYLSIIQFDKNVNNNVLNIVESIVKTITKSCDNILYVLVVEKSNTNNSFKVILEFGPITKNESNINDNDIVSLLNNISNNNDLISLDDFVNSYGQKVEAIIPSNSNSIYINNNDNKIWLISSSANVVDFVSNKKWIDAVTSAPIIDL